jgi:hypothetical protein
MRNLQPARRVRVSGPVGPSGRGHSGFESFFTGKFKLLVKEQLEAQASPPGRVRPGPGLRKILGMLRVIRVTGRRASDSIRSDSDASQVIVTATQAYSEARPSGPAPRGRFSVVLQNDSRHSRAVTGPGNLSASGGTLKKSRHFSPLAD